MVYLTMTPNILEALEKIQSLKSSSDVKRNLRNVIEGTANSKPSEVADERATSARDEKQTDKLGEGENDSIKRIPGKSNLLKPANTALVGNEPSLTHPKLGDPISHDQVIDLSKNLIGHGISPRNLDTLLRGSRVYVAPPPPKPEPTSEYSTLMARLRREEEARSYERMTNPPPQKETFAQRFPMSSAAHAFPSYQEPQPEDELTYAEINRQMTLILNVLVSIVACAGAIWVIARWWSTPARLALSMGGSILVGVAEVVVYGGYIRRVGEAKGKEKTVQEVKEVLRTWVVGGGEEDEEADNPVLIEAKRDLEDAKARRRKKEVLE